MNNRKDLIQKSVGGEILQLGLLRLVFLQPYLTTTNVKPNYLKLYALYPSPLPQYYVLPLPISLYYHRSQPFIPHNSFFDQYFILPIINVHHIFKEQHLFRVIDHWTSFGNYLLPVTLPFVIYFRAFIIFFIWIPFYPHSAFI